MSCPLFLIEMLTDPNDGIRLIAVKALGRHADAEGVEYLRRVAVRDTSRNVRKAANSHRGWVASLESWDTPPKMKRVMPSTGMPLRRASRLWESSWTTTEAKKRRLVTSAMPHRSAKLH